jgi:AcrR family transcriptional regulator
MAMEAVSGTDRRHRRREETLREIVDVAVELMGEHGAAGLSLGDVARRMGIRTPSLYGYFDSKNALYNAVFERGWRELRCSLEPLFARSDDGRQPADLVAYAVDCAAEFARWGIEHPAYAQLLFWRPVPGYEPSAAAYASAVETFARARQVFGRLQVGGLIRDDVDLDQAFRQWTVLVAGVVSQQLANAPHEPYDGGTFTAGLPQLITMFLQFHGPIPGPSTTTRRSHASSRRSDR